MVNDEKGLRMKKIQCSVPLRHKVMRPINYDRVNITL